MYTGGASFDFEALNPQFLNSSNELLTTELTTTTNDDSTQTFTELQTLSIRFNKLDFSQLESVAKAIRGGVEFLAALNESVFIYFYSKVSIN